MVLVDPEILEAGRQLSLPLSAAGLLIGTLLWLCGAWTHRFWVVLSLTLLAGVYGLLHGPDHGMQPIVAGLILAVAAGTLGLALMRVLAFVTGGWAFYIAARLITPAADEPLLCFIVGGLFSVFLYRLWITTVSSVAGSLLIAYSSLWLIGKVMKVDTVAWAANNTPLWNWGLASFMVLGVMVQFVLQRTFEKFRKARAEKSKMAEEQRKADEELRRRPPPPPPPPKSWWPFGGKGKAA